MSGLDWLFTPNPRSEEHMFIAPLQASTTYYCGFTLPRIRSPAFRSGPRDLRHFHTLLLASCEYSLSLRIHVVNIYARHEDQLPGPLFETYGATFAAPFYNHKVSGSLHTLSRVLFNVRSLYYSLSDSQHIQRWKLMPPNFLPHIQETVLWIPVHLSRFLYGTITLYCVSFQTTLNNRTKTKNRSKTPHLAFISERNSVCAM